MLTYLSDTVCFYQYLHIFHFEFFRKTALLTLAE